MGILRCAAAIGICFVACDPRVGPPRGEAVIVVDTDMPVPKLVSRVRVDVYDANMKWIASREIARALADQWPFSFSIATDAQTPRDAILRLRAYPGGHTRDYRGERYQATPMPNDDRFTSIPDPTLSFGDGLPRLITSDGDVTPPTEPAPLLAIDRLVHVHLEPGIVGKIVVLLAGACMGTQADLANAVACVDTERQLVAPIAPVLDPDLSMPASHVGEFEKPYRTPCPTPRAPRSRNGIPLHDDQVCIEGGAFILGGTSNVSGGVADDYPERLAVVPSFLMDKYEFTVGRMRQAIDDGYVGDSRWYINDGPANDPSLGEGVPAACTASTSPLGREEMPLNCVVRGAAEGLCRFEGGELAREVQWEWVSWAGGSSKNVSLLDSSGVPECRSVAVGRGATLGTCTQISGYGVPRVTFGETEPNGDVEAGVVGLWGDVAEWTRDAWASMNGSCWRSASFARAGCPISGTTDRGSIRGSDWRQTLDVFGFEWRTGATQTSIGTGVGFRCVHEVP